MAIPSGAVHIDEFRYDLPPAAIAQAAIEPRDSARLLVTSSREDRRFGDLPELLEPGDLLVVNRTRVRAARLVGHRADTGGRVELLLLRSGAGGSWEALARPARRLRPGVAITFGDVTGSVVAGPDAGVVTVEFSIDAGEVEHWVQAVGSVPLPPYFSGTLPDPGRYQTMFADRVGSAAAPTAALHFTPRLVAALTARGIEIAGVALDIGLDTFRPIATDDVADHVMHRERYEVPEATADAIASARRRNGRVVAVGTTVVRTLETAASERGAVRAGEGISDLFIAPGYRPRVVDALITNFHAPGTSLVVLVAALLGDRWREVYDGALDRGYRFLSFGDAMLIDDPVARRD